MRATHSKSIATKQHISAMNMAELCGFRPFFNDAVRLRFCTTQTLQKTRHRSASAITSAITAGRLRMGQANDPLHRHRGYALSTYLDPEKEQATLRVVLGGLAAAVYGALAWSVPSHAAIASFHALALYLIYGVATRLIISRMQRQSNLRLAFTTVADQALLTVVLGAGGALTLPMLWAVFLFLI